MAFKKQPLEKFQTRLRKVLIDNNATDSKGKIKIDGKIFFQYSKRQIKYSKKRYYPTKKVEIVDEDFEVIIPINHENLNLLSTNAINPPNGARKIVDTFKALSKNNIEILVLGAKENKVDSSSLFITKELYDLILKIDKEEGKDRVIRLSTRIIPFLNSNFSLTLDIPEGSRNYSLLLKEIIASGEFTQQDLIDLFEKLDSGAGNNIIIEKQINKQVEWLLESIENIIDEAVLNTQKAKDLGSQYFGFSKVSISGPEELMEKILTKYGKYTLFGVPALLNTNKYVINSTGLTISQFDIILINHLGDIEVVELKRPDAEVLDYDESRGKFYLSKDVSIAVAQSERYISSTYKDNDEEFLIDGIKIREFINSKIGNTLFFESVRPSALIIVSTYKHLAKPYSSLSIKAKKSISERDYDRNSLQAYKELKNSLKHIKILTYSELLEHARTRLQIIKDEILTE